MPDSNSPKQILWLTEHYYPDQGGMAISCDRLVRNLCRENVSITVLHFNKRYSQISLDCKSRPILLKAPSSTNTAQELSHLWEVIAERHALVPFDQILAFGGNLPFIAAPVYSSWLGIPFSTCLRGNDFDLGVFTPGRKEHLAEAITKAKSVVVVSPDKIPKIHSLFAAKKILWIPNGIDTSAWAPLPSDFLEEKNLRLQFSQLGKLTLGFFGDLKHKKGLLPFISAIAASNLSNNFHLLLVGDVEDNVLSQLRTIAPALSFTLVPHVDRARLIPYYLASDMVCIPSLYDGMPNVLLEAAAVGRPLLTSSAGAMSHIFRNQVHAIMFKTGSTASYQAALRSALAISAEDRTHLANTARDLITKDYSTEMETRRFLQVPGINDQIEKDLHPSLNRTDSFLDGTLSIHS